MNNQLIKICFYVIILFCFLILQTQGSVFGDCPPSYCIGFDFDACNNSCFDTCRTNMQCLYGCWHSCGLTNSDCSDEDRDGIVNICDNCSDYNPGQEDSNGNGIGDACEHVTTTTTTIVPPTVVSLIDFKAIPGKIIVTLMWSTESETDNAGFNIYRAESENGEYIKINGALIPAQGSSTQGASYEFVNKDVKNRKTYYYKLEDIDLNGQSTMHGPKSATPRWILGIFGIFKK